MIKKRFLEVVVNLFVAAGFRCLIVGVFRSFHVLVTICLVLQKMSFALNRKTKLTVLHLYNFNFATFFSSIRIFRLKFAHLQEYFKNAPEVEIFSEYIFA